MAQADSVHSTPQTNTSVQSPAGSAHALETRLAIQQREREKTLQNLARLRKKASDEIHRLIAFLDASDPYASRELEDQVDDGPCEHQELEPSLGSFDRMTDQPKAWRQAEGELCYSLDAEQDDAEPRG